MEWREKGSWSELFSGKYCSGRFIDEVIAVFLLCLTSYFSEITLAAAENNVSETGSCPGRHHSARNGAPPPPFQRKSTSKEDRETHRSSTAMASEQA